MPQANARTIHTDPSSGGFPTSRRGPPTSPHSVPHLHLNATAKLHPGRYAGGSTRVAVGSPATAMRALSAAGITCWQTAPVTLSALGSGAGHLTFPREGALTPTGRPSLPPGDVSPPRESDTNRSLINPHTWTVC